MSKYSARPPVDEQMVETTIAWLDASLVEFIPVMIAYPAFSAKLLEVALTRPGNKPGRWIKDEAVRRSMEALADPLVANTAAVLFDPAFVHNLLTYALNGNQAIHAVPDDATPQAEAVD